MDDFKEIAYFAVSLVIAAFIITLVVTLGNTTGQMAEVRNGELLSSETLRLSRYYSAYDNQLIMGADVIALMRENAVNGGTLEIYVERDSYGVPMTMNATNVTGTSWRLSNLTQRIKADAVYRAILVYDGENPATAAYSGNPNSVVTGIKITVS